MRLAEEYYALPPQERLGNLKNMIELARAQPGRLRSLLVNRMLLKPSRSNKRLFVRRLPYNYFTISELADRYCRRFWNAGVHDVLFGRVEEPPTGEVLLEAEETLTFSKEYQDAA